MGIHVFSYYGMHIIFLLHFCAIHAISFWVGPLWFSALQLSCTYKVLVKILIKIGMYNLHVYIYFIKSLVHEIKIGLSIILYRHSIQDFTHFMYINYNTRTYMT